MSVEFMLIGASPLVRLLANCDELNPAVHLLRQTEYPLSFERETDRRLLICFSVVRRWRNEIPDWDFLKHQMCLAAFINNTDMVIINSCQAGISGSSTFIQQEMMRFRPGHSIIKTDLNRLMSTGLLRMWI